METTPNQEKPAAEENTSKKPKYDSTELMKIFDDLLFNGEYTEEVKIRGKLAVTFRTRSTSEVMDIAKELDKTSYNLISTLQQERAFQALIYSLSEYQGKDLTVLSKEDKIKFLNKLPLNIVDTISNELAKFDDKVAAACQEGEQNF